MSAETLARASEAVADKRWRWAQRMLALDKYRQPWTVVAVDSGGDEPRLLVHDSEPSFSRYGADASSGAFVYHETCDWRLASELLPDLDDAATLGCLLALVREAWICDEWRRLTVEPAGKGWTVILRNARHRPPSRASGGWNLDAKMHPRYSGEVGPLGLNEFPSEAAALVAALLGSP